MHLQARDDLMEGRDQPEEQGETRGMLGKEVRQAGGGSRVLSPRLLAVSESAVEVLGQGAFMIGSKDLRT